MPDLTVSQVIDKISHCRKLHNGVMVEGPDGKQMLKEYSLDEAAVKVGINKRVLDDCLV